MIIGSPPCQTFSSVGQGKIKSINGDIKKDIRNFSYCNNIKRWDNLVSYFKFAINTFTQVIKMFKD